MTTQSYVTRGPEPTPCAQGALGSQVLVSARGLLQAQPARQGWESGHTLGKPPPGPFQPLRASRAAGKPVPVTKDSEEEAVS